MLAEEVVKSLDRDSGLVYEIVTRK